MSSTAAPYTGGDIKKSGELGKMFDVDHNGSRPRKSGQLDDCASSLSDGTYLVAFHDSNSGLKAVLTADAVDTKKNDQVLKYLYFLFPGNSHGLKDLV
ncbi:uncharacterized membrane protein-like protein [Tanacetum coccineum]